MTTIVTSALKQNFDVRIAAERVLQARAVYASRRSDQFPSVGASADVVTSGRPRGATAIPEGADRTSPIGKPASASLGARCLGSPPAPDRVGPRPLRRDGGGPAGGRHHADCRRHGGVPVGACPRSGAGHRTAHRATWRCRGCGSPHAPGAGIATALDVRQAEQLLYIARARIASVERAIAQTERPQPPARTAPGRDHARPADRSAPRPPAVPAGLPSTLLERRPDIRQAEQELIAANARDRGGQGGVLPGISLTGLFGVQSRSLSDLLTGGAGCGRPGSARRRRVFNAGRTGANVRYAEAVQRELVVNYQRAIYTALREVADALAGYRKTRGRACRAGAAGRGAGRIRAPVHTAIRRRHRQLLAGARRAAQLFQGELDLARLRQQELGVDRPALSRARRRLDHGTAAVVDAGRTS